jgi:hypothetical protein
MTGPPMESADRFPNSWINFPSWNNFLARRSCSNGAGRLASSARSAATAAPRQDSNRKAPGRLGRQPNRMPKSSFEGGAGRYGTPWVNATSPEAFIVY